MLCVRAGSQGRLTPLVIDLPADEQPMEIVVFTTGSQGESLAVVSVAYAAPVICLCSQGRRSAVQVIISMIIEKQGSLNTAVLEFGIYDERSVNPCLHVRCSIDRSVTLMLDVQRPLQF